MGHCVEYVLSIPGIAFNNLFAIEHRANSDDLEFQKQNDCQWEGTLPHTSERIGVELTGVATIVDHPVKYTRFLIDKETEHRVKNWETTLRSLLPQSRIVRLCESLLLQWELQSGEYWFRDSERVDEFYKWIEFQDPSAWAFI